MSPSSAPDAETGHDMRPLAVTGHDALALRWSLVDSPSTRFSACRNGLISDLLLRCGEGDVAAFESVVDIFYSVVWARTALDLPDKDVEGAVHEIFVSVWRRAPAYRPGGETAVEWVMGHGVLRASASQE